MPSSKNINHVAHPQTDTSRCDWVNGTRSKNLPKGEFITYTCNQIQIAIDINKNQLGAIFRTGFVSCLTDKTSSNSKNTHDTTQTVLATSTVDTV